MNIYWKLLSSLNENNIYSKKLRKWIIFFIIFYIIAAINNIFLQFYPQQISIIRSLTIFTHLTICILIFYRPKFINRSELTISIGKTFRQNAIALIDENKFKLEFHTNQYFLNPNASIENFTELMNVNASILNEYINQKTNLTFNDLVNKTRVEHFVAISSSNQYKNLTIEGLATLSGFGSKQTFYRNFKKFHGGSPSNLNRINE
jgi:AraC-like DNA-binding protein